MQKDTLLKAPVLAALLFCAAAPAARAGTALTLSEAVAKSVSHSYELKSRDAELSRAEAGARQAAAMRLPVLQLRSDLTRGDDPVYVFGSLLRQKKFGMSDFAIDKLNEPEPKVNFSNSLELGLPMFTGFKIRDYRRLAGIAVEQGRKVRGFAEKGAAFETIQKYLMLALKTELARIADETISSTKEEIAAADRLKDKGFVLGSDYYAAQAVLSSLSAARTGFINEARGTAAAINVRMGLEPETPLTLPGTLGKHVYRLPAEQELIRNAGTLRGDISAAKLQAEAAEIQRKLETNSSLPQISAFAALQTNTEDFASNPFQHMAGISMTIPFGDFARGARGEEKAAAKAQAENSALAMRDAAAGLIAEYYRNYESAEAVLPQAEETIVNASRSLELFKPMFRQGRQSVLEVVRAEAALMGARAALAEAVFKVHSYYAALMFFSGNLDETRTAEISAALSGVERSDTIQ